MSVISRLNKSNGIKENLLKRLDPHPVSKGWLDLADYTQSLGFKKYPLARASGYLDGSTARELLFYWAKGFDDPECPISQLATYSNWQAFAVIAGSLSYKESNGSAELSLIAEEILSMPSY